MGKPEGKRLLGKTGLRLEDNIKMNSKCMTWDGMD